MYFTFQKTISHSQATLPVVGVVAVLLWCILPPQWMQIPVDVSAYGLWRFVPSVLTQGTWSAVLSALCAAVAVYQMAELNYANVLLRVNTRMLSSMLALLLGLSVVCHQFSTPGSILMVLTLSSFFPLFASYQHPVPHLSFLTHLALSAASLLLPQLLWLVPIYWLVQTIFRTLTFRSFIASLLALLTPYWCYAAIAYVTGTWAEFMADIQQVANFQWPDYTLFPLCHLLTYIFTLLVFIVGTIDFFVQQFSDKTRIRIIYRSMVCYGIALALFIALLPQHFAVLLPLLLLPTAILHGHFFTLTQTRASHIIILILLLLAIIVITAQYISPADLSYLLPQL